VKPATATWWGAASLGRVAQLSAALDQLIAEFGPAVGPGDVESVFADSRQRVGAARAPGLTRDRLRAVARSDDAPPAVLFVCVHNAGRSQMASGWLAHLAEGRVDVYSGGSEPVEQVNPAAVEAMAEVGIDIRRQFPKPWSDEVLHAVDVVVTMGCGDECPYYPGTRYTDWDLDDPAGQGVDAVRPIRDDIEARVRALLDELLR